MTKVVIKNKKKIKFSDKLSINLLPYSGQAIHRFTKYILRYLLYNDIIVRLCNSLRLE